MALAANALTTLTAIQAEAKKLCDAAGKDLVERLINVASDRIENITCRSLTFEAGAVETVKGLGGVHLFIDRAPLLVINSITFNAGDPIDLADIKIDVPESGRIFRSVGWNWTAQLIRGVIWEPLPDTENPQYVINYDGGYVTPQQSKGAGPTRTLPFDLEDACIQLVLGRLNRKGDDMNIKAQSMAGYSVSYGSGDVPDSVMSILNRYKRLPQA